MKKIILLLSLIFALLNASYSQTIITKNTISNQYTKHIITKLDFLRPDDYNTAVYYQLGVIGNDFWGKQKLEISKNPNRVSYNFSPQQTATDYETISGYKETFLGKVGNIGYRDPGNFGYDDDLNILIYTNPKYFSDNYYKKIKDRKRNYYPASLIEGEIDINNGSHSCFLNPGIQQSSLIPYKTDICLYGPWVEEVFDGSEESYINTDDHTDVHEIHPAEQFWWVQKTNSGFAYFLNAAIDASSRFQSTDWANDKMKTTFAIAFDIKKNTRTQNSFSIKKICSQEVYPLSNDTKMHYLIIGNDTLITVNEPAELDILNISFEKVGIDPYSIIENITDTTIKGFVVIQTQLKTNPLSLGNLPDYGNLKMIVNKTYKNKLSVTQTEVADLRVDATILASGNGSFKPKKVKVTLKEISTLKNEFTTSKDFLGTVKTGTETKRFGLTGYIFADVVRESQQFSKSSKDILNDKPQYLFPLQPDIDGNRVIKHGESGKTLYNSSCVLNIYNNDKISIISDFVAGWDGGYIRTIELNKDLRFRELILTINDFKKGVPMSKEITLSNYVKDGDYHNAYTMKFKLLLELLD